MDEQKKNYDLAVEYMNVKDAIDDDYLSAAELFTLAGDYLDAKEKAEECKKTAEQCKKKMLAEKKKKKRRGDLLAWTAVIVCIGAFLAVKMLPNIRLYTSARSSIKSGSYEKANSTLCEIDDGLVGILLSDRVHYNVAQKLFDSEEYFSASEGFAALGNYSDSDKKYILSLEKAAEKCASECDEKGTSKAISTLADNKKYADKFNETAYNTACALIDGHGYQAAFDILKSLGEYKDSAALIKKIPDLCYKYAEQCLEKGDSDSAIHFFGGKCMKYYKDSMDRAHEISYDYGCEMLENKDYAKAEKYLLLAKNTGSSSSALNEAYYQWGKVLMENGDYEGAIEKFDNIGWYKDTVSYKDECHYILACELSENGETEKALKKFTALTGYKDSDEKAAALSEN